MPLRSRNAYEVLGVAPTADLATIKKAYRRAARRHHPDLSSDADAHERMKAVVAAWATLRDPGSRASLDRELAEAAARAERSRARRSRRDQASRTESDRARRGARRPTSSAAGRASGGSDWIEDMLAGIRLSASGGASVASSVIMGSGARARSRSYSGPVHRGDLRVGRGEDRAGSGIVAGNVFVAADGSFHFRGRVDGKVVVEGGVVRIEGLIRGGVEVHGGELLVSGWVEGGISNSGGRIHVEG